MHPRCKISNSFFNIVRVLGLLCFIFFIPLSIVIALPTIAIDTIKIWKQYWKEAKNQHTKNEVKGIRAITFALAKLEER